MNQNQLHTPGPWASHGSCVYFPQNAGGFNISNCPNAEANARLIAAAPTMAEYIERRAVAGDAEAAKIMEAIHA